MSSEQRRDRLQQLINLACLHKDWTRVRLAKEMKRDRSRLFPQKGDPKLSYLMKLAEILEWPLETVVRCIWTGFAPLPADLPDADGSFEEYYRQGQLAIYSGDRRTALPLSDRAFVCARNSDERARAINLKFVAYDGLGEFIPAQQAIYDALRCSIESVSTEIGLRANLALSHIATGDLVSAQGVAHYCLSWFKENPPRDVRESGSLAFAHYAHASVHRRLAARYPERLRTHMQAAAAEFRRAEKLLTRLADEFDRQHLAGIANTCRGGRYEAEAVLGRQPAERICQTMLREIDDALARPGRLGGDWLESYGWWTVSGGNIALRHLRGRDLQRALRHFTDQAIAIARQMDNWAFRERALSMEHALRHRISRATGFRLTASIEDDDVRWITGTIGRFPDFQQTGWEILQDARLVC